MGTEALEVKPRVKRGFVARASRAALEARRDMADFYARK
jgi:hypothetical protein